MFKRFWCFPLTRTSRSFFALVMVMIDPVVFIANACHTTSCNASPGIEIGHYILDITNTTYKIQFL